MKLRVLPLCGVVLLTGCAAAEAEPTASPRPVASAASPEVSYPAPDPDYMDAVLAKLGPVPASETYTPEQAEAARMADADLRWETVMHFFPDAQRPEYSVVRQIEPSDYIATVVPCLESRGVRVQMTYGDRGFGVESTDLAARVNTWLCDSEYPVRPQPPFTPAQLGYIYDYFVQFKAPCIEGLGYEVRGDPPPRETFIADWPRQGYNPWPENVYDEEAAAVELACPNFPEGLR